MNTPLEASLFRPRDVDNVWAEVQHRARTWMESGTPVYTLSRNVSNQIIDVSDTRIHRRSVEGHSLDDQTAITRAMIALLWNELERDGRTGKVKVLRFAYALLQRSISGIAFEPLPSFSLVVTDREEARRPFTPGADEIPGLKPIQGRPSLGRRGGGEGEIHAALKAKVKHDPVGAIGERLTYLSEDLTDQLGDEISFITGDRVDLLMKDQDGRYVVIEVEPAIGPVDHVGFHQAAKYWALLAVSKQISLDRVRRMVVATSIDPMLREFYESRYNIEWREVSLP